MKLLQKCFAHSEKVKLFFSLNILDKESDRKQVDIYSKKTKTEMNEMNRTAERQ